MSAPEVSNPLSREAREVIADALSERNRVNGGIHRKLTHVYSSEAAAIALDALSTEGWEVRRADPSTKCHPS